MKALHEAISGMYVNEVRNIDPDISVSMRAYASEGTEEFMQTPVNLERARVYRLLLQATSQFVVPEAVMYTDGVKDYQKYHRRRMSDDMHRLFAGEALNRLRELERAFCERYYDPEINELMQKLYEELVP